MSWDETLFGWLYGAARRLRSAGPTPEVLERRASLEGLRTRLRFLASALGERSFEVREAEGDGAWRDDVLFLPAFLDFAIDRERNELAYVVRVAWVTTAWRLRPHELADDASEEVRALASTACAAEVLAALREELPVAAEACLALAAEALSRPASSARQAALDAWVARQLGLDVALDPAARVWAERADGLGFPAVIPSFRALAGEAHAFPLFGGLGTYGLRHELAPRRDANDLALPSGTERKGRAVEHLHQVELPDDPLEDNPLVHSFEKVHTAEEYRGGVKNQDGEDELAEQVDALEELDLREVVRSMERTRSLLRVDVMLEGGAGDVADEGDSVGQPYPEWDARRGLYRDAWCHVRARRIPSRVSREEGSLTIARRAKTLRREHEAVRAELERLEATRRWKNRQLDGSEIDDDAVVDRLACLAAGTTPPDRLHRQRRRSAPSLAVMLLLDASLSTDGWVDDVRVLDLEIDATVTLGEALSAADIELGIAAFHSHTRRDCRFEVVKSFVEPWGETRHRLASLEPRGYTRIGPALRHATELLAKTEARRRLLLLLTDGKPNDYDRYEGKHGVADVRQAVREAENRSIHVHAFAIDHDARFHLPRMLGSDRYHLLRHPRGLARAMGDVLTSMRR